MKRTPIRTLLALLLCLAMVLAFGGCSAPADNAATPATTQSQAAQSASSSAPASTEKLPPLQIHAMLTMYETPPDTDSAFWKDMEAKFNVDYIPEWVPITSYDDKLSLAISTNQLPDVVGINNISDPSVVKALDAGMFKDFTDYLVPDKYPNLCKISSSAWTNSKYKGRNYLFPRSRGQYNSAMFLRGDLIKKYNLKVPETVDDMTAYLEAIAKEDGMVPVPSSVIGLTDFFQPCFGPGNILPVFTDDKTGIVPDRLTESYALTLQYMNTLYSKGLLSKEFALINADQTEDMILSGKGGMYIKNLWHSYRINDSLKKVVPDGELIPIFGLEGPGGVSVTYDMGYAGGLMANAKMKDEDFQRLLTFFDQTSDRDNYYYCTNGIEGVDYNMVDGFPVLTEEGKKLVNNSFFLPYILATDTFNKVDSPLATPEYNLQMHETAKGLDTVAAKIKGAPFTIFKIIASKSWSDFWSLNQTEFEAFVTDVVTGNKSVDDFRAYQQSILGRPEIKTAMTEYKKSYDEFGLADWKPNN